MEDKILNAIKEPLSSIDVKVSSISFEKEDGVDTLFIKIDSDKVIDTDTCVKATEIINPIIDELNLEELGEYVLDVCSKGSSEDGQ